MGKSLSFLADVRIGAIFLGSILALAHQISQVPEWIDLLFFGFFVIGLGIPHGAIDHIIEEHRHTEEGTSFNLTNFLIKYFSLMFAYGLLWFLSPSLSLLLFLIFSAWHFGESDIQPAPTGIFWKISQFVLGAAVLFFILLRQPQLTAEILYRISRQNQVVVNIWQMASGSSSYLLLFFLMVFVLTMFMAQRAEPLQISFKKTALFTAVLILIYYLPLLPAFALYFGGWHAQNTFNHMAEYLSKNDQIYLLWKKALPFTILALVFLGVFMGIWFLEYSHIDPLPILFIFISIITLPHLLVMHKMFVK